MTASVDVTHESATLPEYTQHLPTLADTASYPPVMTVSP